jgi:hypothetical protein
MAEASFSNFNLYDKPGYNIYIHWTVYKFFLLQLLQYCRWRASLMFCKARGNKDILLCVPHDLHWIVLGG